jgi:hypothetical protein
VEIKSTMNPNCRTLSKSVTTPVRKHSNTENSGGCPFVYESVIIAVVTVLKVKDI